MSCLNCVSAHPRGELWFCNRCGKPMVLRPVTTQGLIAAGTSVRSSVLGLRPRHLGHDTAAVLAGAPDPREADVLPNAVVLDLDAARRVKDAGRRVEEAGRRC